MTTAIASIETNTSLEGSLEGTSTYFTALRSMAKESRRETLLRVARHEFATRGFLATTLSTIAQQTGIRKSTIFHYFATKEALYDGAVTDRLDELADAIERAAALKQAPNESAADCIDAIVIALALACTHEPAIARLMLRTTIEEGAARTVEQRRPASERIVTTIADAIRRAVAAKQIPRCAPTTEALAILFVACSSAHAMARPPAGAASAAAAEVDEPVLIGVSSAQAAAAVAMQVRRLLDARA